MRQYRSRRAQTGPSDKTGMLQKALAVVLAMSMTLMFALPGGVAADTVIIEGGDVTVEYGDVASAVVGQTSDETDDASAEANATTATTGDADSQSADTAKHGDETGSSQPEDKNRITDTKAAQSLGDADIAGALEKVAKTRTGAFQGISTLGAPTGDPNDAPQYGQLSLVKFLQVANGQLGGLALDNAGRVWTWGYNGPEGQLGIGSAAGPEAYYWGGMKRIPFFIDNNITIVEVGTAYQTRYALTDTGEVYAWGEEAKGGLGNGSSNLRPVEEELPTKVPGLTNVIKLYPRSSADGNPGCIVMREDGTLWGWGAANEAWTRYVFGFDSGNLLTPTQIPLPAEFTDGTREIVKVAFGSTCTFILDDMGDVWAAGSDEYGQMGNGTGRNDHTSFTKMDRSLTGMDKIIDIDVGYSRLQTNGDRVAVITELGNTWEWGTTYGNRSDPLLRVDKQTPTQIILDPAEVAAFGYTPTPQKISVSQNVCFFVDQYGRTWGWGSGQYHGFGEDGGWTGTGGSIFRAIPSTAAQQVPKVMGDGDSQDLDTDPRIPVYLGGTMAPDTYGGYGFNPLHPTIYDEKYMMKDANGNVVDELGRPLKLARLTTDGTAPNTVSGLTRYMYYLSSGGAGNNNLILPEKTTAVPAVNPNDRLWIDLAGKPLPFVADLDLTISGYCLLDSDGNIYKWGYDGSGTVAWGWDYDPDYDANGNLEEGLYDRYTYEVMYMRGAPTIDNANLTVRLADDRKIYKDPITGEVTNSAIIDLHVPASTESNELSATVHSDVTSLMYVVVPYDESDPAFNTAIGSMTLDQFMAIYNAAASTHKGELLDSPIGSGATAQDLTYTVNVPDNGKVLVWAINDRYAAGPNNAQDYLNRDNITASVIADNIYTPILFKHRGVGEDGGDTVVLYEPTNDNVVKTNDDSADTKEPWNTGLYGLPLGADNQVIGAAAGSRQPTYGYDEVSLQSYEAIGDVGIPAGIKPYWKFKTPQDTGVSYTLDDVTMMTAGVHDFLYEKNPDYWTDINGLKTWEDGDNVTARPESIELTLKKFERSTTTGAPGDFIEDVVTITVKPDEAGVWSFDFGNFMSYEYTYRVVETAIPNYTTTITYPNQVIGAGTKEDFSEISIVNELNLKPVKLIKVDSEGAVIVSDYASFVLTNATEGESVLNVDGNAQDSITLQTDTTDGTLILPAQTPGTYHLTETKAPAGYSLLTKPVIIVVNGDGSVEATLGGVDLKEVELTGSEVDEYAGAFEIPNKVPMALPATSGYSPLLILILAMVAILEAGLLWNRHRKRKSLLKG